MLVKVNPKSLFGTLMPPSPLARWGRVYPISPCSTRAKGVLDLLPQIRLRAPVFHTGERQHVSTAGSLAPSCGYAAQRLRSANPFFRSSPPSMPHYHAAGGRRSMLATLAPPAVKVIFNTILQQSEENIPGLLLLFLSVRVFWQ